MDSAVASTATPWRLYIWLASTILVLALLASIAAGLYADRHLTIMAASESTEQSATITGVIIDQIIRDFDAIVATVQTEPGMHPEELEASVAAKAAWIERRLEQRPAIRGYAIIDRDGTAIAASFANLLGQSLSDRPYFAVHRDGRVPGLYATDPFISLVTGYRLFLVTWPLRAADGDFLGVVAISFDTDEIELAHRGDDQASIRYGGAHEEQRSDPCRELSQGHAVDRPRLRRCRPADAAQRNGTGRWR